MMLPFELVDSDGGRLPFLHFGVEGVFQGLITGIEVFVLRVAGGENRLLLGYLTFYGLYLFLNLLHSTAEFAELAFAILALFISHLAGAGLCSRCLRRSNEAFLLLLLGGKEFEYVTPKLVDAPITKLVKSLGESLKEITVVGDNNKGASILQKGIFQDVL